VVEVGAPSVRILLVRHAQQVRDGQDGELTPLGRAQAAAAALAVRLAPDDRLVSSSLVRTAATAAAFGRPPERFPELDEFRFGPDWTWTHVESHEHLALWRGDDRRPGGESLREFGERVVGAVTALLAEPPAGRLVLVVHAGVIDAVLRWAFGLGPDAPWTTEASVPHASFTELDHWPRGRHPAGASRHTVLVRLGDVRHLPPELVTDP
jgi:broad specificity phosphatase PhoE